MTVVADHLAAQEAGTDLSDVAEGVFMHFEQYGFIQAAADLRFNDQDILAVVWCLTVLCAYFPGDHENRAALIEVITRLVVVRCSVDEHDALAMFTEVLTLGERWQLVLKLEHEYEQSDRAYRAAERCCKSAALTKLLGIARAYKRAFQNCMFLQDAACKRTRIGLMPAFTDLTASHAEKITHVIPYVNSLLAEEAKDV